MSVKTENKTELSYISTDTPTETVCFVCTGNTCRSPMAEAVFNKLAKEKGVNMRALSAGLAADGMSPMSKNSADVLRENGVEFDENFTSTQIDAGTVAKCDKIVGITGSHAMSLIMRYPQFATKIFAMPCDIPDPYGCDIDAYRECFQSIKSAIEEMLQG